MIVHSNDEIRAQLAQFVRADAQRTDTVEQCERKAAHAAALLDEEYAIQQPNPPGFTGLYTGAESDRRARSFRRFWIACVAHMLSWQNIPKESELPESIRRLLRSRWPATLEGVHTDATLVKLPAQLSRAFAFAHIHTERENTLSELESLLRSLALSCLAACLHPAPNASLVQVLDAGLGRVNEKELAHAMQRAVATESQLVLAHEMGHDTQMRLANPDIDAHEAGHKFLQHLGAKLRETLAENAQLDPCLKAAAERAIEACARECSLCAGSLIGSHSSMERKKVLSYGRSALAHCASEVVQEAFAAPSITEERKRLSNQQANAVQQAIILLVNEREQSYDSEAPADVDTMGEEEQSTASNKWEYMQQHAATRSVEHALAMAGTFVYQTLRSELESMLRPCMEEIVVHFVPKDDILEEMNEELGTKALDEEQGGLLEHVQQAPVEQARVATWREYYDAAQPEKQPESRRMELEGAIERPMKAGRCFSITNTGAGEGSVIFESSERAVARGVVIGAYKASNENPTSEEYIEKFRRRTREEQEKKNRTRVEGLENVISSTRLMPTTNNIAQPLSRSTNVSMVELHPWYCVFLSLHVEIMLLFCSAYSFFRYARVC